MHGRGEIQIYCKKFCKSHQFLASKLNKTDIGYTLISDTLHIHDILQLCTANTSKNVIHENRQNHNVIKPSILCQNYFSINYSSRMGHFMLNSGAKKGRVYIYTHTCITFCNGNTCNWHLMASGWHLESYHLTMK